MMMIAIILFLGTVFGFVFPHSHSFFVRPPPAVSVCVMCVSQVCLLFFSLFPSLNAVIAAKHFVCVCVCGYYYFLRLHDYISVKWNANRMGCYDFGLFFLLLKLNHIHPLPTHIQWDYLKSFLYWRRRWRNFISKRILKCGLAYSNRSLAAKHSGYFKCFWTISILIVLFGYCIHFISVECVLHISNAYEILTKHTNQLWNSTENNWNY